MNFDKYIGTKIDVLEGSKEMFLDSMNMNVKIDTYDLQDKSIINEIKTQFGGKVRVWLPDSVGDMRHDMKRLNVYINKVGESFQITEIKLG